jgi:hypothetical protein
MFVVNNKNDILPYRELAHAIILQAVDDYRKLLRGNTPVYFVNKITIDEIEEFFKSKWFSILSNIDGELLIEKLRKECEDERKDNTINKRPYRHYR